MIINPGELLSKIDYPEQLRKLRPGELKQVCDELRHFIIDVVSSNPGHFGASLGVVELTVALHYVFNTPYDQLVWDVGHQAYGHKILTGRRDVFHTNRKFKGISGFPKMSESIYDAFGVGHSSTSISAALGMAVASRIKDEPNRQTIAIIGDGAMTGGMALEALNNAGIQKSNLLVILNDNDMAIDPNVGGLKEYLTDIRTSITYNKVKKEVWDQLSKISKYGPPAQVFFQKLERGIKSVLLRQSNLFEGLRFRYFGPADGHDIMSLVRLLSGIKRIPGPKLLHVITQKGKGFLQAELDQTGWHAPGLFDKFTGQKIIYPVLKPQPPKYQDVFGKTILELARKNDKIVGVTPAMPTGCSLNIMMQEMPERVFDVGIAEQHAVTFSAGLASQGLVPFCNIYSSFMQRAYDQIIHDVALQKLHVVFCLDRGGLVGEDGATHHGAYDLAYMRTIPDLIISAPMDECELRNLMYTAQLQKYGAFSIRYPKGRGICKEWETDFVEIPVGKGRKLKDGKDIALLTIGYAGVLAQHAIEVVESEGVSCAHYDMRFLKPIDEGMLHEVFNKFDKIITIEDGTIKGGLGSEVVEFMADNNYSCKVKRLGIPDKYIEHGTQKELYGVCGFDVESICREVRDLLLKKVIIKTELVHAEI